MHEQLEKRLNKCTQKLNSECSTHIVSNFEIIMLFLHLFLKPPRCAHGQLSGIFLETKQLSHRVLMLNLQLNAQSQELCSKSTYLLARQFFAYSVIEL